MSSPAQSPTENEPVGMQSSTRDRSASVDVAPGGLPRDHRSSSLVNPSVQVEQSPAMLPPQPLALRNILKGFSQDSGRETQGPSREESIDKEPSSSDVSSPKSESPTESPTEGQDDSTSSSEKSTQNSSNETTVPSVSIPFSSDDSSTGPKDDFSDDSATVRYTTPHPIAKCQIVKPDRLAQITDQPGFTPDTTTMGSLVNPVSAVGTMTNVPDVTIDPTITSAEQRTLGDTDSVPTRAVKAQLPPPSKPKISEWFEAMFTIGKYGGFLAAIVQFITIFIGLWLDTSFKRSDTYMCTLFLVSVGVLVCVICGTFEEKGQIEWCSVAFILDAPLHIIFFVEHQTPAVWWAYPGVVCAICLSLRVSTGILCKPEDYYMKVLNYHWQQRHHEIVKPTFRNRATSTGNLEAAEAGSSMGASSLPLGEARTISRGPSRGDGRPDSRADSQATSRNVSRMDSRVASRGPSEAIIHEASTSNSSSSENEAVIEAEAEVEPLRKGEDN